jgi:hypothetical protein
MRRHASSAARLLDAGREDSAPELSLINLVDLMLVFAVGLMLAVASHTNPLTASSSDSSAVDTSQKLSTPQKMKLTGEPQTGAGTRIGSAYRLPSGEIVYVPESSGTGKPGSTPKR